MSDATFTTPESLALLRQAGMPVWRDKQNICRIRRVDDKWWRETRHQEAWWAAINCYDDHEAACLIREHLRVKLAKKGIGIAAGKDADYDEMLLAATETALSEQKK